MKGKWLRVSREGTLMVLIAVLMYCACPIQALAEKKKSDAVDAIVRYTYDVTLPSGAIAKGSTYDINGSISITGLSWLLGYKITSLTLTIKEVSDYIGSQTMASYSKSFSPSVGSITLSNYSGDIEAAIAKLPIGEYNFILKIEDNYSLNSALTLSSTFTIVGENENTYDGKEYDKPKLRLSQYAELTALVEGSTHEIQGIVKTDVGTITEIGVLLFREDGEEIFNHAYYPNSKTVSLSELLKDSFRPGMYEPGSYTLFITAEAVNGYQRVEEQLREDDFVINQTSNTTTQDKKPTLSISGATKPSNIIKGDNFGLRGTIKTDCGKIINVTCIVTDSSGKTVLAAKDEPNAATCDVKNKINGNIKFGTLDVGTYTYVLAATAVNGDQRTAVTLVSSKFTVKQAQATEQKPTLTISGATKPSSITKGNNFGLRGTIKTDCGKITKVTAVVTNASGSTVLSGNASPNAASHDIQNSINNSIKFGSLETGTYTYTLSATAVNGAQKTTTTLVSCTFTVKSNEKKPTLTISGASSPSSLTKGSNFGLRGTIKTDYGKITSVTAAVKDSSGKTVLSGSASPNAATHDVKNSINNSIKFGSLNVGTYTYTLTATATNGDQTTTTTLVSCTFTVTQAQSNDKKPTLTISGATKPSSLSKGGNFGLRGTIKTDCGKITNVTGVVKDSTGKTVLSGSVSPNATSHDIKGSINNSLKFGSLAVGTYTYTLTATAVNGDQKTTTTLVSCTFTVSK